MFKHYFEGINNIEVWPIISLILFMLVFIAAIIYVVRSDKKYIDYMKNLPFHDGESKVTENATAHEDEN